MSTSQPVKFDDVSAEHLEKYLHRAIEILLRRQARAKYTHDKKGRALPTIMINPPDIKVVKKGKQQVLKHVIRTEDEISPELHKELVRKNRERHAKLKQKYDERISDLQSQIKALESDILGVLDELDQYMNGSHPHLANHLSKDDLDSEIKMLENKLSHYENRSEKYHELVVRLTQARKRLHALDV